MTVAAIRADDVNIALLVHVLGAMLLVGTLLVVSVTLVAAWRRTDPAEAASLTRFGLRTLLVGVLPAYIVMRVGAQWTEAQENPTKEIEDSPWLGIGYITADAGAILILISVVLAVLGLRKLAGEPGARSVLPRIVAVVSTLLLAAYIVAVWAMTAKPG